MREQTNPGDEGSREPLVSVVVPVRDEEENIRPLLEEIAAAFDQHPERYEIVYVDDASRDGTLTALKAMREELPHLRILHHRRPSGQSAAIRSGIEAARGRIIVTLDGDGQNDPADAPQLLRQYLDACGSQPTGGCMVMGQRRKRHDSVVRRLSSRIANTVRNWLLNDGVADVGCGLKVFGRDAYMKLPYFDHMHRFMPALMVREGFQVLLAPVAHRPRERGKTKYGIWNRLWVGLIDLFGVLWLLRRRRLPEADDLG